MKLMLTMKRMVGGVLFLSALGWTSQAHAQFGIGTWVRTDAQGKGMTMTVERCCNGGYRLTYHVPSMGGQPPATLTVDSPMDGTEVPVLLQGKPSGETMAVKRVDGRHYSAVVKMNGKPFGTSNGTLSADGNTLTVETVMQGEQQIIETWARK
jgi:hypothetical protein